MRELEVDGGASLCASEGYGTGGSNVLRLLGYFSLTGLLRVHCLIGDYHTGLEVGAGGSPAPQALCLRASSSPCCTLVRAPPAHPAPYSLQP